MEEIKNIVPLYMTRSTGSDAISFTSPGLSIHVREVGRVQFRLCHDPFRRVFPNFPIPSPCDEPVEIEVTFKIKQKDTGERMGAQECTLIAPMGRGDV